MTKILAWFKTRAGKAVLSDAGVAVGAGAAVLLASQNWTGAVLSAAGMAALKALLRAVVPIPDKPLPLQPFDPSALVEHTLAAVAPEIGAASRLHMLPDPSKPLLGRLPKIPDSRDVPLARFKTSKTKAWPAVKAHDWATAVATYFMLLNNQLGDCTIAALLDMLQTICAAVGTIFTPTDAIALAYYEQIDGYVAGNANTDRGGYLANVTKWWKAKGVAGHKIAGYVTVDITNKSEIEYAIATFGGLYIGVELTNDNYQKQGVHWTVTAGANGQPNPDLGHCIYVSGFDSKHVKFVTWAQKGYMTWACFEKITDEAYAVVSPDFIASNGVDPAGLSLATLTADLAAL